MNAPATAALTETQLIERSLDELLRVATLTEPPWPPVRSGPVSIAEIADDFLHSTPAQRSAQALFDNPVGEAVRVSIRALGKRLHEIGGVNLMSEVLVRAAEKDPAHLGHREDIMDKRWDGIGRTADNAGWCC